MARACDRRWLHLAPRTTPTPYLRTCSRPVLGTYSDAQAGVTAVSCRSGTGALSQPASRGCRIANGLRTAAPRGERHGPEPRALRPRETPLGATNPARRRHAQGALREFKSPSDTNRCSMRARARQSRADGAAGRAEVPFWAVWPSDDSACRRHWPIRPSIRSRRRSACPRCCAY